MKREKAITLLQCSVIELTGTLAATKEPTAALQLQRYIDAYNMGIEALRAGEDVAKLSQFLQEQIRDLTKMVGCDGCVWEGRKRPQKCSCCRRNPDMKDCYKKAGVG